MMSTDKETQKATFETRITKAIQASDTNAISLIKEYELMYFNEEFKNLSPEEKFAILESEINEAAGDKRFEKDIIDLLEKLKAKYGITD